VKLISKFRSGILNNGFTAFQVHLLLQILPLQRLSLHGGRVALMPVQNNLFDVM
jgi:hypothetical protein